MTCWIRSIIFFRLHGLWVSYPVITLVQENSSQVDYGSLAKSYRPRQLFWRTLLSERLSQDIRDILDIDPSLFFPFPLDTVLEGTPTRYFKVRTTAEGEDRLLRWGLWNIGISSWLPPLQLLLPTFSRRGWRKCGQEFFPYGLLVTIIKHNQLIHIFNPYRRMTRIA